MINVKVDFISYIMVLFYGEARTGECYRYLYHANEKFAGEFTGFEHPAR